MGEFSGLDYVGEATESIVEIFEHRSFDDDLCFANLRFQELVKLNR